MLFQALSDNSSRREQEALAAQRRAQREEQEEAKRKLQGTQSLGEKFTFLFFGPSAQFRTYSKMGRCCEIDLFIPLSSLQVKVEGVTTEKYAQARISFLW